MSAAKSTSTQREQWTGQYGFIIAAVGSAIGLGNIWRFPGVAYTNGGGAFLIPYLVALLTAGLPILLLDYALGHRYRGSAPTVFRRLKKKFEYLGWIQVLICLVIMTYYSVILAWAVRYTFFSVDMAWGQAAGDFFTSFLQATDPGFNLDMVWGIFWPLLAIWVVAAVIMSLGVAGGLERANRIFIPILVLSFLALVIRALFLDGAVEGLNAFFTPDWSALTNPQVWIAAYSQIFFSLSVAFGIMLTYSSYLKKKANITSTGLVTGFANSSFELLAGIGVFATLGFMAVAENTTIDQLEGISGPTLSFVTFPTVISMMPGGPIFGIVFFVSLTIAGFTSLVSLLQVVSAAVQEKFGISRRLAAVLVSVVTGSASALLFATTNGINALDVVDKYINEIGIVSSAVAMTVLVLFAKKLPELRDHLNRHSSMQIGTWWYFLVAMLTPAVLLFILGATAYSLLTEGYGGMPQGFINVYGWFMILGVLVVAAGLTFAKWKTNVDDYDPVDFYEEAR